MLMKDGVWSTLILHKKLFAYHSIEIWSFSTFYKYLATRYNELRYSSLDCSEQWSTVDNVDNILRNTFDISK
jgi:phosphoglucomutase